MKEKTRYFLQSLEKYTKTDMVYMAKNGSWLTLGQGASSFISLILAISFAHFLPKEVYGNYKYILSLGGIFAAFSLTGIGTSMVRSIANGYDGTLRYNFWLNIKWSLVIFLGSLASSIYYFINENTILGTSFLIIGSFSPFLTSASLHGTYLSGKKDFRRSSLFNIYKRFIPAIALLVTMTLTQNVILLILIYFISNTAITFYYYRVTLKLYHIPMNAPVDPENLPYAKHLSLMNILGGVADKIDSVLVFHYLGAASLSVYVFSMAIPDQIIGWVKNINTLALPKFAKRNKEDVKKELCKKMILLFFIFSGIYLLYYLFSPKIYFYFFPQYLEAITYSQVYAIMLILTSSTLINTLFDAHKAIKEKYATSTFSSIVRIILLLVLTSNYGIWGAITAQVSAKILAIVYGVIVVRRF